MYTFNVKTNDEDYLEFNKYHLYNQKSFGKANKILRIFLPIFALLVLVLAIISKKDVDYIIILSCIYLVLSVLWLVFYKRIMFLSIKKTIDDMKKQGRLPYSAQSTLTFSDEGITEVSETGTTSVNYKSVEKIAVNADKALYIYFTAMSAFLIPLSMLPEEVTVDELVGFIEEKTGRNAIYDTKNK